MVLACGNHWKPDIWKRGKIDSFPLCYPVVGRPAGRTHVDSKIEVFFYNSTSGFLVFLVPISTSKISNFVRTNFNRSTLRVQ